MKTIITSRDPKNDININFYFFQRKERYTNQIFDAFEKEKE